MSSLKEIFTADVLAEWRRLSVKHKDLCLRLAILSASGPYPITPPGRWKRVAYYRALRAAWEAYFDAAIAIKLFEGDLKNDLNCRLRDTDEDIFRGAVAECFAAWFLAGRQKLDLSPRPKTLNSKIPDFSISHLGRRIFVEVKAKHRDIPPGVWSGFDDDALQDALKAAVRQFPKGEQNLLVVVPTLRGARLFNSHTPLIKAFYGEQKIIFQLGKRFEPPSSDPQVIFVPNGKLLNRVKAGNFPGNTRVSAVLCLEEKYNEPTLPEQEPFIEPMALVLHNPFAEKPIPLDLFSSIPQFVPDNGKMVWNNPAREWDRS